MIIYSCNLCDVNVRPCPQRIRIFWIYHLIFSGFKNSPSTCYQILCECIIFHSGEQIYTQIWWLHMDRLKKISRYVWTAESVFSMAAIIMILVIFAESGIKVLITVCFFLNMLLWCHVTSVKEALHFYVKAALLFNSQTDTNI